MKTYDHIYDAAVEAYQNETFTVERGISTPPSLKSSLETSGETYRVFATKQGFSVLVFLQQGTITMTDWGGVTQIHREIRQGSGQLHIPPAKVIKGAPANKGAVNNLEMSMFKGPGLIAGLALNMLTFDSIPLGSVTLLDRLGHFLNLLWEGRPVKEALIEALKSYPTPYPQYTTQTQTQETQESTTMTMTNPIEAAVSNERNTTSAYSLNSRKAALLMMTGYTTCLVCYDLQPLERMTTPPKLFTFLAPVDLELAKEDIIVVPAKEGQFDLARVVHVDDLPQLNLDRADTYKWVVSKVDFHNYNALVKRDEEIARAVAQAEHGRMREQLKASLGDLIGPEALTAVNGEDGFYYLDTTNQNLWFQQSGLWRLITNLGVGAVPVAPGTPFLEDAGVEPGCPSTSRRP